MMNRERGATAVEYALMASLIALVIFGAVTFLGEEVVAIFSQAGHSLAGT